MAVVHGQGLDPFTTLDPFCFFEDAPTEEPRTVSS